MIRSSLRSFGYAFSGIFHMVKRERNARIHLLCACIAIALGLYQNISRLEWALILGCIFGVFSAEAFNTAIETLADMIHPDHYPAIKHVKDLAAGAVLFTAIGALFIGLMVFFPTFYRWFSIATGNHL